MTGDALYNPQSFKMVMTWGWFLRVIPWLSHDYPTIIPLCPQIPIYHYIPLYTIIYRYIPLDTIIYHYSHYSHYYPIKVSHYDPTIIPILPINGHTTSPFHTSLRYASWPLHWLPSWGWCIASRCGSDGPWINLADDWMMILYIYIILYYCTYIYNILYYIILYYIIIYYIILYYIYYIYIYYIYIYTIYIYTIYIYYIYTIYILYIYYIYTIYIYTIYIYIYLYYIYLYYMYIYIYWILCIYIYTHESYEGFLK